MEHIEEAGVHSGDASGVVPSSFRVLRQLLSRLEDEATGAAAVTMGDRLGRQLTIRQGVGSEILVRPQADGTIEIGGRVELVETREYVLPQ
jgi:predicted PhzF superfamily epimerase YddE/YHI9